MDKKILDIFGCSITIFAIDIAIDAIDNQSFLDLFFSFLNNHQA
jgi:hypothetical protein